MIPSVKGGRVECEYSEDHPVGLEKYFRANGDLCCTKEYDGKSRRPNGSYKEYYPDGKIAFEGTYSEGTFTGDYFKYDEDGNMIETGKVSEGHFVKSGESNKASEGAMKTEVSSEKIHVAENDSRTVLKETPLALYKNSRGGR